MNNNNFSDSFNKEFKEANNLQIPKNSTDPIIITKNGYSTSGVQPIILAVRSSDRDESKYPNSGKYVLDLEDTYRDIIDVELLHISCIFPQYIVNNSNNYFYVVESFKSKKKVFLQNGNYDEENFLKMFKRCISKQLDSSYQVRIKNGNKPEIIIVSCLDKGLFGLDFTEGSQKLLSAKLLGFNASNYGNIIVNNIYEDIIDTSDVVVNDIFYSGDKLDIIDLDDNCTKDVEILEYNKGRIFINKKIKNSKKGFMIVPHKIRAPFTINLNYCHDIAIKIRDFENIKSPNKILNDSFGIINISPNCNTVTSCELNFCRKLFNPPLPKLYHLDIQFLNMNGTIYDFNNVEHILVFKITMLNRPEYATIINHSIDY